MTSGLLQALLKYLLNGRVREYLETDELFKSLANNPSLCTLVNKRILSSKGWKIKG